MAEQQSVINLEWMDQEVRRYRSELVAAQQRINAQQDEIRDLNRHIEELEGRLAAQQTQMNRINVLERALEQYKEEIRLLVEQQEETYQQDRRESARIKLIEQDSVNRGLNELRKSWAGIPRLEEEIELRAAEERRLNETLLAVRQRTMDLEKRIDTVVRPIPYLEEQRTRDAKYIAQLQEQTASLRGRHDEPSARRRGALAPERPERRGLGEHPSRAPGAPAAFPGGDAAIRSAA